MFSCVRIRGGSYHDAFFFGFSRGAAESGRSAEELALAAATLDTTLHLHPRAIAALLRDWHAGADLPHHRIVGRGDRVVEFAIGAVEQVTVDHVPRVGSGRRAVVGPPLRARASVLVNIRSDAAGDAGTSALAHVDAALVFEVPVHRGRVPDHLRGFVRVDPTATSPADVTIEGLDEPGAEDLKVLIATLVQQELGGTFPLPPEVARLVPMRGANVEVFCTTMPTPQLVVKGVRPDGTSGRLGAAEGMDGDSSAGVVFGSEGAGWSIRAGGETLRADLAKIEHGVRGIFQRAGPAEVRDVKVDLRDGYLEVRGGVGEGGLSTGVGRIYIGNAPHASGPSPVKATWASAAEQAVDEAAVTSSIEGLFEAVVANVLEPESGFVPLREPEARFATRVLFPEVTEAGILLHGALERTVSFGPPQAKFSYLRQPGAKRRYVLNAGESWSPGSRLSSIQWQFGDGSTATYDGASLAFVETHEFPDVGDYDVTLRVTDRQGRTATTARRIGVGRRRLSILPPHMVRAGVVKNRVIVSEGGLPAEVTNAICTWGSETVELSFDDSGEGSAECNVAIFPLGEGDRLELGAPGALHVGLTDREVDDWPVRVVSSEVFDSLQAAHAQCEERMSEGELPYADRLVELKAALLAASIPWWCGPLLSYSEQGLAARERGLDHGLGQLRAIEAWLASAQGATRENLLGHQGESV
jgi:PKD domain